jgi:ABC-type transport system involved in multi-copper enzyme maturation permease subunit
MNEDLDRKAAERAHENLTEFTRQNYEAAFKSGQIALRTVVLVNGGAAVAVLFFLGIIAARVSVAQISIVASSLIWFVAGITCGLIALTCAYLTNLYDANVGTSLSQTWQYPYNQPGRYTQYFVRVSRFVHIVAIVAGTASLVLFIVGMWDVRSAIILIGK